MHYNQKINDVFTPDLLKQNLVISSIFIAVYENFKFSIVDNVKQFYNIGFVNEQELFEGYEQAVLSKVNSKKIGK